MKVGKGSGDEAGNQCYCMCLKDGLSGSQLNFGEKLKQNTLQRQDDATQFAYCKQKHK